MVACQCRLPVDMSSHVSLSWGLGGDRDQPLQAGNEYPDAQFSSGPWKWEQALVDTRQCRLDSKCTPPGASEVTCTPRRGNNGIRVQRTIAHDSLAPPPFSVGRCDKGRPQTDHSTSGPVGGPSRGTPPGHDSGSSLVAVPPNRGQKRQSIGSK